MNKHHDERQTPDIISALDRTCLDQERERIWVKIREVRMNINRSSLSGSRDWTMNECFQCRGLRRSGCG